MIKKETLPNGDVNHVNLCERGVDVVTTVDADHNDTCDDARVDVLASGAKLPEESVLSLPRHSADLPLGDEQ